MRGRKKERECIKKKEREKERKRKNEEEAAARLSPHMMRGVIRRSGPIGSSPSSSRRRRQTGAAEEVFLGWQTDRRVSRRPILGMVDLTIISRRRGG
jgi:hypothetical protein